MALDRTALPATVAIKRRPAVPAMVQRSAAATARPPARTLQERLGNHATQAYVARSIAAQSKESTSQAPKLPAKISKKNDPAELEAEEKARNVVRMREPAATPSAPKSSTKGVVQRVEAASPRSVPSSAHVNISGGSPLPPAVRGFMEPRFGASFANVRVHTGEPAAKQSADLNAHAFTVGEHVFFGANKFQPQSAGGRELIAHELAHTIQQGAAVQRSVDTTVTQRNEPRVQRFGISDALDWIADKANYIPGFRMLTIVLGMNPINFATVDRSAANILRALLELVPVVGPVLVKLLDSYGVFDKVGAWMEGKVRSLGLIGSALKSGLDKFLDSLSWRDIFHLGDVYDRARRIFTDPIDQLIELGKSVVADILGFIRDAVLMPLAKLAEGTRGYDLLKALLGKDPITGQPVPRNAETLIGGFMKLIGEEEVWENIKKANAVARAFAWFEGAAAGLKAIVVALPTNFINALKSLEVMDFVILPKAFLKVGAVFGHFILDFLSWAGNAVWDLLLIILDVVAPGAVVYLKKTGAALKTILKNPLPFVHHLAAAAKLGFNNFSAHFRSHLLDSLLNWLTGSLPGVYIPKALSLPEIAKLVFSVMGLSWAYIRQKLVKVVGETTVKAMEKVEDGLEIVVALVRDGPMAAWEKLKETLSDLQNTVVNGILDMVFQAVIKKAAAQLAALFVPGLNFIVALIKIYDIIMVFVRKLAELGRVVKAFVDSIVAIAGGAIEVAAERVEGALAGLLTLAINFLAAFAGVGNIADKVMGVIDKIRGRVDQALDKLVAWIANLAKKAWAGAKAGVKAIVGWWNEKFGFKNKAGESHEMQFIGTGDDAKLGIESDLMTVREYLDTHPEKGKPEWNAADAAYKAVLPVIYSPARKTEDEKKRRQTIKDQLAKVSAALAKLGGGLPTPTDYGKSTVPTRGNPVTVDIVDQPLTGTATGPWPKDKPGYKQIYERGLTEVSNKWVQMHIMSEKLGGSGTDFENLVPAPQNVNVGPFRSFEHAAAKLASGKSGGIKNRVWVEVLVTGAKHAATAIAGKAGLYFWKGKPKEPQWLKNATPALNVDAAIPPPQLGPGPIKLVLNFSAGTEMQKDFGIDSKIATLIKEGRPYQTFEDFTTSMTKRGATVAQVNAVLAKGAVLNGP